MRKFLIINFFLFLAVALHAQSGNISINVRLYGGIAPFRNSQWNNWNTGTSARTNITSGLFKYANGTASNVSAVLSAQGGLGDNGAAYAGNATMCPDTVLRYASYSTTER